MQANPSKADGSPSRSQLFGLSACLCAQGALNASAVHNTSLYASGCTSGNEKAVVECDDDRPV